MNHVANVIVAAALAATGVTAQSTTGSAYDAAQFQRDLDAIQAAGITGVLGEVRAGRHRITGHSGVANATTNAPVPEDGYFRVGSVTKTYVAVVVLQLVGEGRLSLEDTVDSWLPGVVSGNGHDGRAITIRQLLQHTSGIYNYTNTLADVLGSAEAYRKHMFVSATPEELVARAMAHPPAFRPGTSWAYSNTNYILAGMVVKAATGRSWHDEVRTRILAPLGLRHTFYPGSWPFLPRPHARGYHQFTEDGPLVDTTDGNYTWAGAAGGLVTTAAEYNRFWRAVQAGELLRPAQQAEMHRTVLAATWQRSRPGARYGLGIASIPLSCGGLLWGHGGDAAGYAIVDGASADGRRGVVLSLSTQLAGSGDAYARARDLVDRALCATDPVLAR